MAEIIPCPKCNSNNGDGCEACAFLGAVARCSEGEIAWPATDTHYRFDCVRFSADCWPKGTMCGKVIG